MRYPTKKPTPSEFAVLAVTASVAFILMGIVVLVIAWRAPAAKQELAAVAMWGGFASLGVGCGIAGLFWIYRRYFE